MPKPSIPGDRWVAIYQSICLSSIWTDTTPIGKNLAVWLIIHANHTTKHWHGITINRGQQFRSISNLAEDIYCSRKSLSENLRQLERLKFISLSEPLGKNRGFLITIKNYYKFQFGGKADCASDGQFDNQADHESDDDGEIIEGPVPGMFKNGTINVNPRVMHHWKIALLRNCIEALPVENREQAFGLARVGLTNLLFFCAKQQKVEFEDMPPEKLEAIVQSGLDPNDIWNAYIKAQLIKETDNGIIVLTEELLESLN